MRVFLLLGPFALAYALLRGDWLGLIVWASLCAPLLAYLTGVNAGHRQMSEALDALAEHAMEETAGAEHVAKQRQAAQRGEQ